MTSAVETTGGDRYARLHHDYYERTCMSSLTEFPQLLDFLHVWALAIADFFRPLGIDFPPADWGTTGSSK